MRITDTAIKPCVSTGSDFRVSVAPSTEWQAKVRLMWQLEWTILLFCFSPSDMVGDAC